MNKQFSEQTSDNLPSVSEENSPKPRSWWRELLAKLRTWLALTRQKNPKLFDAVSNSIQVVWVLFSTFWTAVAGNAFLAGIGTCIAFGGLYLFQWALLTNKLDRSVADEREITNMQRQAFRQEREDLIDLSNQRLMGVVELSHSVMHNIKLQISKMPNQDIAITREAVMTFLQEVLNSLEENLGAYYGHDICASIKLCTPSGALKTFARGSKNVARRGGRQRVKNLNKKSIRISDNYAYSAILKRQLQFFAEGDLRNLTEKETDDDHFYCEYGKKWEDLFLATIVIPIRYPVLSGDTAEYKMLGVVCIDTLTVHPEWSGNVENYAYQITAFIADAIYGLIERYMIAQQENRKKAS